MCQKIRFSGQARGTLSVWKKKDQITGHARSMGHYINSLTSPGGEGAKEKNYNMLKDNGKK
jgi:hypothetical protein